MLQVKALTKSFGDRRAVDGVSFSLEKGRTLGLIGPNGAGKSTTVGMVCGLIQPDSGEVLLNGQRMQAGASAAKQTLGLVPQDLALYEELSARENLRIFGALYGLSGALLKQRVEAALELVSLSDRAGDKPSTFSGGMKRRLNIAAAMLHQPPLLILDEPTVGVDPQSRNAIFDCLEALQDQGHSLIYTSHYMEEVERLADHIVVVDHGKVIADATPASLYQQLPAKAALQVELAAPLSADLLTALASVAGVREAHADGVNLRIALITTEHAKPVLDWLAQQGVGLAHFATARTNLEEIFLTLTGRNLRDGS